MSPAPTPIGWKCATSAPSGVCGPYVYAGDVNSNGYNTYVDNNCWADPSCKQTVSANSPGDWQVTATEPAGNTGVRTAPLNAQQMDNWTGTTWGSCGTTPSGGSTCSDTPISKLSSLTSSYAEAMPHNSQTIAESAWDIWLNSDAGYPGEMMIWVDNVNRGSGGARQVGSATISGQAWTAYEYGTGEFIWSLGAPGTFGQQPVGTVDILALLRWMQGHGFTAAGATIGLINFGWEICSTGGGPETFRVSKYTVAAS